MNGNVTLANREIPEIYRIFSARPLRILSKKCPKSVRISEKNKIPNPRLPRFLKILRPRI